MSLITSLCSFFTLLSVLAPATAQVVQTSASCPWSTGSVGSGLTRVNASLAVSGTPAAGASLQFSSNLQMTTSGPYLSSTLYVMAIGVGDPGLPLSSCGCTLRTSLDWLDAQSLLISTQGGSWGLPHFGVVQAAPVTLNIPPGISNVVLHAQGFFLGAGISSCQEFGLSVTPTESYRITIP
tara:strand:- start:1939 stop:2481 length:543 start_codon:yes stop_codon:yes gene_type:complete